MCCKAKCLLYQCYSSVIQCRLWGAILKVFINFDNVSAVHNPFRYSGELQYLRARWYDPSVGRFLNEDTFEGELDNPLTLNLYTYVTNNPLKYIDPSGRNRSEIEYMLKNAGRYQDTLSSTFSGIYKGNQNQYQYLYNMAAGRKGATAGQRDWARAQLLQALDNKQAKLNTQIQRAELAIDIAMGAGSLIKAGIGNSGKSIKYIIPRGCNCFASGTKVQTEEGEKNIEDIEVGDQVLAKDELNPDGELAYKEVTAVYRNQRDDIIKLHVGEQVIETTDNHPFWVEGKGWIFADELQVGDKLQKADGSNLIIDKVEFVKLDEPITVYNFTVADYHTYYVTDLGIWVHNTNGCIDLSYLERYGNVVENKLKNLKDPSGNYARMAQEKGITNFNPNNWKKGIKSWENAQGDRVEWHYVKNIKNGQILSQKAFIPGPNGTRIWVDIK